jgi:hypothetical protein
VQTKKAVQCCIIYAKTTPKQGDDFVANNGKSREEIGNNGCRSE